MWKCCSRTSFQPCKIHPTPSIKPQMSLLLTPGSFFGLEAGQVQGLQADKVQPNRQRKLNSDRQKGISWPQLDWNTNALFWECPESTHYFFTSSPSSGHFLEKSIRKLSFPFPLLFVGVVEKDKWPAATMFTWVGFPSHHPSSWQSDVSLITEKNFSRTGQLTWSQKHQPVGLHSLSKAQEAGT